MIDSTPAAIAVEGLVKRYRSGGGTLEVLRGVDLRIERGELVAIVGSSGSGKSTLLHLMGLLDAPDGGAVVLGGSRADDQPTARRDRLRNDLIGMVFQSYHLLPELDAVENVLAPLMVRHGPLAWLTQPHTRWSTCAAGSPVFTSSAVNTSAPSRTGCTSRSPPFRRPKGDRNASTITTSRMSCSPCVPCAMDNVFVVRVLLIRKRPT